MSDQKQIIIFLTHLHFTGKQMKSKSVKELETSVINTTQIWETTITSYEVMEPSLGKEKENLFI